MFFSALVLLMTSHSFLIKSPNLSMTYKALHNVPACPSSLILFYSIHYPADRLSFSSSKTNDLYKCSSLPGIYLYPPPRPPPPTHTAHAADSQQPFLPSLNVTCHLFKKDSFDLSIKNQSFPYYSQA